MPILRFLLLFRGIFTIGKRKTEYYNKKEPIFREFLHSREWALFAFAKTMGIR